MAGADSIRCCAHCGNAIVPKINKTTGLPSERPRIYCGRKCLKAAAEKRNPRKGRQRTHRKISGFCYYCGLAFVRNKHSASRGRPDSGHYCSRECYNARQEVLSTEKAALRNIAASWRPSTHYSPIVLDEVAALRRIAGNVYKPRLTYLPCSGGCGSLTRGYMAYSRTCKACAAEASREQRRRFRKTEAGKAYRRKTKSKRRALERGVKAQSIDPIRVFVRDKWRCHLCGCKTPQKLRGTYEANAPELDHVIPLSLGGTHTWGNVKCACRKCNGAKSAKPMGQLGLDIAA